MTFTEYCAAVCARVRWRRAHDGITAELTAHLVDHAAALTDAGAPREEAQAHALEAMGDPEEIGRAFDRLYSPLWYWLETLLRYAWIATLTAMVGILLWATDWRALNYPRYDDTDLLLSQFLEVDQLEPGDAVSTWWSGGYARLDHAVLASGDCYLFPAPDGAYTFAFRLYDFSRNPFLESTLLGDSEDTFTFTGPAGETYPTRAYYDAVGCTGLTPEVRALTVTYSFLGHRTAWDIPLDWGDAP